MRREVYREMAALQEQHWWFAARRQIVSTVIAGLSLPPSSRILEIGCGTGGNLGMLAGFGQLQAIEYDDEARFMADALGICPVRAGGLPSPIPFEDRSFDLVCLLDVLEHIEADFGALERAGRLLKPSGYLLLTVPAYQWLWSGHDVAHHHCRRYTVSMVNQRAQMAGLNVVRSGYVNTLLFPLIAIARLAAKVTGEKPNSDAALPRPLVNTILAKLFGLERHVAKHYLFPFGTSALVVMAAKQ